MTDKKTEIKNALAARAEAIKPMVVLHQGSSILSDIIGFINYLIRIISTLWSAIKIVPFIGNFLKIFSALPSSLAVLTDANKNLKERLSSALLIFAFLALSILALVTDPITSLVVGTVMASISAINDNVHLLNLLIKRFSFLKSKPGSVADTSPEQKDAYFLERQQLLEKFYTHLLNYEEDSDEEKNNSLDGMLALLQDVLKLDQEKGFKIKSLKQLNRERFEANITLALSAATSFVSTAGLLYSVTLLTLAAGGIVTAPSTVPLLVGVGLGLTVVSLVKFIGEKIIALRQAQYNQEEIKHEEEKLTDQLLDGYFQQSSYGGALRTILESRRGAAASAPPFILKQNGGAAAESILTTGDHSSHSPSPAMRPTI